MPGPEPPLSTSLFLCLCRLNQKTKQPPAIKARRGSARAPAIQAFDGGLKYFSRTGSSLNGSLGAGAGSPVVVDETSSEPLDEVTGMTVVYTDVPIVLVAVVYCVDFTVK